MVDPASASGNAPMTGEGIRGVQPADGSGTKLTAVVAAPAAPPVKANVVAVPTPLPGTPTTFIPWTTSEYPCIDHDKFVIGANSPFNSEIKRIFGRSRDYLIWLDPAGVICFNFNDPLPLHMRPALIEFRRLKSIAPIVLSRKKEKEAARQLLASGLNYAFNSRETDDPLAGLQPARSFIETRSRERSRSNFLVLTTLASLVVFLILSFLKYANILPDNLKEIALGGMAGIVGASMSLIQRGAEEVDPFSSAWHKAFHGILRALLGMIFGMIVVIAAKAKLAFGIATQDHYALFTLALVGGFSERLVPNLMTRLSQDEEGKPPGILPAVSTRSITTPSAQSVADLQTVVQQQEGIIGPLKGLGSSGQNNTITLKVGAAPVNRAILEVVAGAPPPSKVGFELVCLGDCLVDGKTVQVAAYRAA